MHNFSLNVSLLIQRIESIVRYAISGRLGAKRRLEGRVDLSSEVYFDILWWSIIIQRILDTGFVGDLFISSSFLIVCVCVCVCTSPDALLLKQKIGNGVIMGRINSHVVSAELKSWLNLLRMEFLRGESMPELRLRTIAGHINCNLPTLSCILCDPCVPLKCLNVINTISDLNSSNVSIPFFFPLSFQYQYYVD